MAYNGMEIDMLAVGDADCILVTRWVDGVATRILVDGGKRAHANLIRSFLHARDITFIDHVVNTHLDADHAGGLIELVSDDSIEWRHAWMHIPGRHLPEKTILEHLNRSGHPGAVMTITASLNHSKSLMQALVHRKIPVEEPFAGRKIGFMTVCGPSEDYYEILLQDFKNIDQHIDQLAEQDEYEFINKIACKREGRRDDQLLDDPKTSVENNSSVILGTIHDDKKFLLTADAGAEALRLAADAYRLDGLHWMQVPHHGSRKNMTEKLADYFRPALAYASAAGNEHHPGLAVVKALKKRGAAVYSTHHPSETHLWFHDGNVPSRPDYTSAIPM
jgi:beta-lactamase superfamily II metal-dependent hydrolase